MAKTFIDIYKKENPETVGIPYLEMNAPLTPFKIEGHVGLELEIEGAGLPSGGYLEGIKGKLSNASWIVKPDGSLRNGVEYVFSAPCFISELEPMVNGLFDKISQLDAKVNNSNRCSTHVHVNVSGLKVNHLTSILALWSVFETVLISWCGEERTTNHFCLSSSDEDSFVTSWINFLQTGTLPTDGNLKYTALNILPIWTQGSVEFRCGGVPNDQNRIINWAKLVWNLCKYAKEKYPNPHQLAFDLSERGALEIFKDICSEAELSEEFFIEVFKPFEIEFNNVCMRSFRNSQPFVLGFPWGDWQEEIDKDYIPNPFSSKKKVKQPYDIGLDNNFGDPVRERPRPVETVPTPPLPPLNRRFVEQWLRDTTTATTTTTHLWNTTQG